MSETPLSQFEIENAARSPEERALLELEQSVNEQYSVGHLDAMRNEVKAEARQLINSQFEKPEMNYTPEFQIPDFLIAYGTALHNMRYEKLGVPLNVHPSPENVTPLSRKTMSAQYGFNDRDSFPSAA